MDTELGKCFGVAAETTGVILSRADQQSHEHVLGKKGDRPEHDSTLAVVTCDLAEPGMAVTILSIPCARVG
jgi:hypothetical protein